MRCAVYPSLRDRVVLVTGGASGIGASFVRHFALQGSRVAFLDVDDDAANALVGKLSESSHAPVYVACDLRDIDALRAAVRQIEGRLGDISVLVNNAANDDRHEIGRVEPDYFDDRIAVNLRHYFFAVQAVCGGMRRLGGGAVINVGSIIWRLGLESVPIYAACKSAILGLTRTLARELGPDRIRVNCLEPGCVATERQRKLWLDSEAIQTALAGQCLPDLIEPESIAHMALFLAADESRMCSGQAFVVDGGWS